MSSEFAPLAERIVDALLEAYPGTATFAGDHRYDDRLPDYSPDSVAGDVAMLRDASVALSQVDEDTLDAQEGVDHAILSARVDRELFEYTEVREHEWHPLEHNPGPLLYALIARPFAPVAQRLESLAGRLAAIPDALAIARDVLTDPPRIHVETAVGQFAGTAGLIRDQIPGLLAEAPELADRVKPAAERAVAALDEFGGWLRARLATGEPGRDPRLGRRLWEARLWHTLDTDLTAAEVKNRASTALDEIGADLRIAAADYVDGRPEDRTVQRALDRLGDEHPDNASIVAPARPMGRAPTDLVAAHELASLVDDPLVVQELPEFARGVGVAYCEAPGPLETATVPTFYHISPTPADWPKERVESFYREYNNYMVRNLTVHEAMPGHFLQLAHGRRYRGGTRVRSLGFSGPFVEGWAVYAEEVVARAGFGGAPVRLQQLKMQLRVAVNALLDQLIHCEGLEEAAAMALMTGAGFQEEGEAAGKWRRALLTSTQLSTYFVGYTEMSAIGAARPDGTSMREWHDAMLAHGSLPPRHLRTLLGV